MVPRWKTINVPNVARCLFLAMGVLFSGLLSVAPGDGRHTAAPPLGGENDPGRPSPVEAYAFAAPAPLADGSSETAVEAFVTRGTGDVARGVPVLFRTSAGTITACSWTDSGGRAAVIFTPAYSARDTFATIQAIVPEQGASVPFASVFEPPLNAALDWEDARIALLRTAGPATSLFDDGDLYELSLAGTSRSEEITEKMGGVSVEMDVEASRGTPADGVSPARFRAIITDAEKGAPVAGVEVAFRTGIGNLFATALSDERGMAKSCLAGSTDPGPRVIDAIVGGSSAATVMIQFSPVSLVIESSPEDLRADGANRGEIVATLRSEEGEPLAWVPIWFRTSAGSITSPVVTDDNGRAVAILTSGDVEALAVITAGFSDKPADSVAVRLSPTWRIRP